MHHMDNCEQAMAKSPLDIHMRGPIGSGITEIRGDKRCICHGYSIDDISTLLAPSTAGLASAAAT